MRMGVLVGLGSALALVAVSATDASACRHRRVCNGYAPAPVYQYAPPPAAYYAPPAAYYAPPPVAVGYGYGPPAYDYVPAAGYGYRNCDRGYGYGYGNGYGNGYGYGPPPAAYDGYRPAAVWVPGR